MLKRVFVICEKIDRYAESEEGKKTYRLESNTKDDIISLIYLLWGKKCKDPQKLKDTNFYKKFVAPKIDEYEIELSLINEEIDTNWKLVKSISSEIDENEGSEIDLDEMAHPWKGKVVNCALHVFSQVVTNTQLFERCFFTHFRTLPDGFCSFEVHENGHSHYLKSALYCTPRRNVQVCIFHKKEI